MTAIFVGALLAVASASSAAVSEHRLCRVHRCRTLAANVQVRIFRATARHPANEEYESTFAHWLPSGRVTALGDETRLEGPTLHQVAVAGRYVSYVLEVEEERYPGTGFREVVARMNVQTGRINAIDATGRDRSRFFRDSPGVTDVVVTRAGSIAWIISGRFADPTHNTPPPGLTPNGSKALYLIPARSTTPRLLAFSPGIDPRFLVARRGHIVWRDAGIAQAFPTP